MTWCSEEGSGAGESGFHVEGRGFCRGEREVDECMQEKLVVVWDLCRGQRSPAGQGALCMQKGVGSGKRGKAEYLASSGARRGGGHLPA